VLVEVMHRNESLCNFRRYLFLLSPYKPKVKVKQSHTGLGRPLGLQEVEAPRLLDNRHMKVVMLSALRTGRLYPPGTPYKPRSKY
jgi:hypothetical protein